MIYDFIFNVKIGFRISTIFGLRSTVKIRFRMSENEIRLKFECKNRISNVKLGNEASVRMSKEISNVTIWYSASVRMSK